MTKDWYSPVWLESIEASIVKMWSIFTAAQLDGQEKSLDAADRVSFNTTLAACAAGQARIFNKNFRRKHCLYHAAPVS